MPVLTGVSYKTQQNPTPLFRNRFPLLEPNFSVRGSPPLTSGSPFPKLRKHSFQEFWKPFPYHLRGLFLTSGREAPQFPCQKPWELPLFLRFDLWFSLWHKSSFNFGPPGTRFLTSFLFFFLKIFPLVGTSLQTFGATPPQITFPQDSLVGCKV